MPSVSVSPLLWICILFHIQSAALVAPTSGSSSSHGPVFMNVDKLSQPIY
jgi:hypothetical protein